MLAFVHAGASVFTGIEHWSLGKILFFHFLTLYSAYSICYLVNEWIPFEPIAFLIFSVVFVAFYALVWCTVVICVKLMERRLNRRLKKK